MTTKDMVYAFLKRLCSPAYMIFTDVDTSENLNTDTGYRALGQCPMPYQNTVALAKLMHLVQRSIDNQGSIYRGFSIKKNHGNMCSA